MNRYILVRRLRGPAFLLLVGALALLNQANIFTWGKSWPLFLILAGVLGLAERAAMANQDESYPPPPYPNPIDLHATPVAPQSSAMETTPVVPIYDRDFGKDNEGGQS
jgi:hypothetical protein